MLQMIQQKSAQIYLASAREHYQNCWSTFNFGNYQKEAKNNFGSLFQLDYQVLTPNQKTTLTTQSNGLNYILPLFGGVFFKERQQNEKPILTESVQQIVSNKETAFEISNPLNSNVSYLQIGFKTHTTTLESTLLKFDFTEKNKLIPLFENQIATTFIGHFDGRKEGCHELKKEQNGIFVYIIQGAFEFENRLLETGDALSIKNIEAVEWEALSENAMLLLIEIPLV